MLVKVARVAQLDRASVSEAEGCGFNSRFAHQFSFEPVLILNVAELSLSPMRSS